MKRFLRFVLALAIMSTSGLIAADKKPGAADNRIYDQVRMRLANDPDVKGGALEVAVKDGVVTIQGRVDTDKGKKKAEKLAKKVKGVKSVDNEITVGPPQKYQRLYTRCYFASNLTG